MKSRKKISIGVFALVSLLSALFITAVPGNGVTAQDEPTPSTDARLALMFALSGESNAIATVSFASNNCDAPVGGTIHSPSERDTKVALGPTNTSTVGITTHTSTNFSSESGAGADPCDYAIAVTTNLNCTIAITAGSGGTDSAGTTPIETEDKSPAPDAGSTPATSNTATLRLIGTDSITTSDYFTDFTATGALAALFPDGSALGQISEVGVNRAVPIADPQQAGGILNIDVAVSDCDDATAGNGLRISNAEPERSLATQVTAAPVAGCSAAELANGGVTSRSAGTQAAFETAILSAVCTYELSFGIDLADADSPIVLEDNGLKSQCGIEAAIYRGSDVTIVKSDDTATLQFFGGQLRLSLNSDTIVGAVTQVTTYLTTDCPTLAQATFTFETVPTADGTAVVDAVASSAITVTIAPAAGSSPGCAATPASIVINGAGEEAISNLIVRPRAGRTCNYDIAYPLNEGALTLVYENGGKAASAEGVTPVVELDENLDGAFDGVVSLNARRLTTSGTVITAGYTTRNLAITVSMSFPDVEFTTSERVEYLISVVGACARFTPIIARALGQTGTYRGVQAYGGDTTVFDRSLEAQETSVNVSGELLYVIAPVIIVDDVPVSCTVQVDELSTPSGCSIVGGESRQVITFATDVKGFGFNFEHTCVGRVATTSGRSVTG